MRSTIQALKRRLNARIHRFKFINETTAERKTFETLINMLKDGKSIILEFGRYETDVSAYILVANAIARRIHREYVRATREGWREELKPLMIFIEEAQNILKYSYERYFQKKDKKGTGVGLIGLGFKKKDYFFIFGGNIIKASSVSEIKRKLDYINSLDRESLKKYFLKQRKTGFLHEDGGAGLGFIDMAIKSGCPLNYKFTKIDSEKYFFEVTITIR